MDSKKRIDLVCSTFTAIFNFEINPVIFLMLPNQIGTKKLIKLRRFQPFDADQIAQLFHDTIRSVNLGDYTEEQVKAWAPDDIYFRDWESKCSSKFTLVAEAEGIITGFAELEDNGHIDCFYCHKDFQGQGVGRLLFSGIENEAQKRGLIKLLIEASITAKPFFLKMGFSIIEEQLVKIRGSELTNFRMEKHL